MRTVVAIVDAARARFFRIALPEDLDYATGPRLRELEVLVNPEGLLQGKELFGNLKSGRNRAPRHGPAHGLDDHRKRHELEIDKRFAKTVAAAMVELARSREASRIVLVAPPRALGRLRDLLATSLHDVRVETVESELTWHDVSHIQDALERRGLLAPRALPDVHRPPGQPQP